MRADKIDAIDYDNGQKNNWRRMVWNRIAEHSMNRYESVILYLPGENNYDLEEARARNFKQHCLIAVERNAAIVERLRNQGQLVVHSDLKTVMRSWPGRVPVSAVIADLQCPLGPYPVDVIGAWGLYRAFHKSMLILNLQRGREHATARPAIEQMADRLDGDKHRVNQAMYQYCLSGALGDEGNDITRNGHTYRVKIADFEKASAAMEWMAGSYRICRTGSYKSSSSAPVMDWGIVKHTSVAERYFRERPGPDRPFADSDCVRQIAAVIAHRTMRMAH